MRPARGATDLAGVLLIDKPPGLTSHDVVARIRRATGERRVGHAGTLDPMATGLLLVLVGRATRLEQYLVGHDKSYEARIVFGTATDTHDAEGQVTDTAPVPEGVRDPSYARDALRRMLGEQEQVPPAYSAIKRGGVAAHRLARAGEPPVLDSRLITVYGAELTAIDADAGAWDVRLDVSKGTYVRSIARDLGRACGTVAHLGALRRTRVGSADVVAAHPLAVAEEVCQTGAANTLFVDPVPLLELPVLEADPASVRDGHPIGAAGSQVAEGARVVLADNDLLLGVYRRAGDTLLCETLMVPGVAR
ncbi:MAG: tRNA pseudouridine(55) synthase TruB [Actinobacteria bacterium]|nr:tRNA pseudouridine(55) synthase TruB [Actinomycetota bacterium]